MFLVLVDDTKFTLKYASSGHVVSCKGIYQVHLILFMFNKVSVFVGVNNANWQSVDTCVLQIMLINMLYHG